MSARRIAHTLCGVALLVVLASSAVGAFIDTRRTTIFTFSGSVQLPGVVLPAGTYIFEVANHQTEGDLVRVLSRDRSTVYLMAFTRFTYRPLSNDLKPTITLGESSGRTPPPVSAWYPDNDTRGREFLYR